MNLASQLSFLGGSNIVLHISSTQLRDTIVMQRMKLDDVVVRKLAELYDA